MRMLRKLFAEIGAGEQNQRAAIAIRRRENGGSYAGQH